MTYPTRRARIEAEQAEKLALRSQRSKRFTLGMAGLATAASASMFGLVPANAAIDDGHVPPASSTSQTAGSQTAGSYTVKSGDTLAAIASAQGVSLNQLMSTNNLSASTIIYPGDVLELPGSSSTQSATQSSSTEGTSQSGSSSAQFASVKTASSTSGASWAASTANSSSSSYRLGANGEGNQWDCSSFSQQALSKDGKSIPRTSAAQYASAQKISKGQLQSGDLVFFGNGGVSHVAVYVGNGQIAHARNPSAGLSVNDLDTYAQYSNVIGYGRY